MRIILITTAMIALPLMAMGQGAEPQPSAAQTQKEKQEAKPAKKKKAQATPEATKPESKTAGRTEMRAETKGKTGAKEGMKTETATRSTKSQTNVEEFKTRHREVFTLGRHRKDYFVERYGPRHVRLIGNTYFVFVDGCWVAVDAIGFVYTERVICQGDPDFIMVY